MRRHIMVGVVASVILFLSYPLPTGADIVTLEEQIEEEDRMAELEMLAILVHAEAGNQSAEGKQAVAGVVLNRRDSALFPNTIKEVIYQSGQFSCINDGGYDRACWNVDETDYAAVSRELKERKYRGALFFRTKKYHDGRTPLYKIGDHYFSK